MLHVDLKCIRKPFVEDTPLSPSDPGADALSGDIRHLHSTDCHQTEAGHTVHKLKSSRTISKA